MKHFLILLALLLLPAVSPAAPRLQAEDSAYNFGRLMEGSKISHTFRFQNTGDQPLIISRVRSSCGCTAALLSAERIAPGAWGELKTTFNSSGFQGTVNKTITLYSNDPAQKTTRFRLHGEVAKELAVEPLRLRFGADRGQTPFSATVRLRNDGAKPLFLSDLKTTSEELQAELPVSRLDPGQVAELAVGLNPSTKKDRFAGYVTLRTSSPRTPLVRIPVTAVLNKE